MQINRVGRFLFELEVGACALIQVELERAQPFERERHFHGLPFVLGQNHARLVDVVGL